MSSIASSRKYSEEGGGRGGGGEGGREGEVEKTRDGRKVRQLGEEKTERERERERIVVHRGASFVALSFYSRSYRQCLATLLSCVGISSISLPTPLGQV